MTPEAELKEFLRKPKNDADDAGPPTLPPHLGSLPHTAYMTAALEYLDHYPFDRPFIIRTPVGRVKETLLPSMHQGWDEKARSYLKACVEVDRTSLASIDPTYDANLSQQRFIHEGIFKRRWTLEELASEIIALVELVCSETRTASAVATPMTTGKGRVMLRDEKCRLSGVLRSRKCTAEEKLCVTNSGVPAARLEVAHGLPYGMGETSFSLVEVLTGLPIMAWGDTVDCVENTLMMNAALHKLFGAFQLYLESGANNVIYIRARKFPADADPTAELSCIANDEKHLCNLPFVLIDAPLRPPNLQSIPDIDMKFFTLHKFIGDVVWMCGGAEPESDDDDEEEEDMRVLSANNWPILQEKLTCADHFVAHHDGMNG